MLKENHQPYVKYVLLQFVRSSLYYVFHKNKSLQWKLAAARLWTGKDLLDVLERHGYSRLVMEQRPAGDRHWRMWRVVTTDHSRLCFMMNDDDDDDIP